MVKYQPTWTLEFNTCREQTGGQVAVQHTHVILFQTTPTMNNKKKTYN